jgi:hypothetical protein
MIPKNSDNSQYDVSETAAKSINKGSKTDSIESSYLLINEAPKQ